jgi:beta-glucosidase
MPPVSVPVTTLLSALRTELAADGAELAGRPATVSYARGCDVRSQDSSGFAAAVAVAKAAEVVVAVVGRRGRDVRARHVRRGL